MLLLLLLLLCGCITPPVVANRFFTVGLSHNRRSLDTEAMEEGKTQDDRVNFGGVAIKLLFESNVYFSCWSDILSEAICRLEIVWCGRSRVTRCGNSGITSNNKDATSFSNSELKKDKPRYSRGKDDNGGEESLLSLLLLRLLLLSSSIPRDSEESASNSNSPMDSWNKVCFKRIVSIIFSDVCTVVYLLLLL